MASVYILYSKSIDNFYSGSCKDLSYRINQHINHDLFKSFTLRANDWELFFFVDDLGYEQARKIERHIKKMKSRAYLFNLKKYPKIIEKLISKYQ